MTPEKIRGHAIKQHLSGELAAAEEGYRELIHRGINDPDVLSNYALICQESHRVDKAQKLYEQCVSLFPSHAFANANLGYLYLSIGNIEKAEACIRKAISLKPDLANSYSTLGLILKSKGDLLEAEKETKKAININPNLLDAYINLGLILKSNNKLADAEKATRKAIEIDPGCADAYLNLGTILQDQGKLEEAKSITQKALALDKGIADANMNLGAISRDLGNLDKAIIHAQKEIEISPNKQAPYLLLNSLIKECNLKAFTKEQTRKILRSLLVRNDISHSDLFQAINHLTSKECLKKISKEQKTVLDKPFFNQLISDREIVSGLKLLVFCSLEWELALRKIRKDICLNIRGQKISQDRKLIEFTIALAHQCFLNEYIFNYTNEEIERINELKTACLQEGVSELTIATMACYEPLKELIKKIPSIKSYKSNLNSFKELISLQLNEPLLEEKIAQSLSKFENIKDEISKKVQIQYEENPYPRWRYATHLKDNKMSILSAINNEIRPNRISHKTEVEKCKVLIAGCGTGQQILDADRYQNAEITAIDLSSSSLAYAKRKVSEYSINNIKFYQMDILELPKLNQKFDLIECCGVLHHMNSPEKGLSALVDVLSENGFLKLALYSDLARADVVRSRNIIQSEGIDSSSNGIRLFREHLISGDLIDIKNLHQWSDFYTMSMCRDLCFHVQEHRYSVNEIEKMTKRFNLNFLGFILDFSTKHTYSREYVDDKLQINLKNWHEFEKRNPHTFRSMYQFWVSKATGTDNEKYSDVF